MNNIIVAVMDRNGWNERTDIIIYINTEQKMLQWIPRDLYSNLINNRINAAYRKGGANLLLDCLKEFNIYAEHCVCVLPLCFDENIKKINTIKVPVDKIMIFRYPLHRHIDIEKGSRIINFLPPYEILQENRFHEWIGARNYLNQKSVKVIYPDIDRIKRQQILLKELLKINYSFVYSNEHVQGMNENVLEILKTIDLSWTIQNIKETDFISVNINNISGIKYS